MTTKNVKNEQWSIKLLVEKIKNNNIIKPKFQRKKKWDLNNKTENNPNEKSYIQFLCGVKNSVHAITFGQNMNSKGITYTNIDGNNRLNAIKHFIDKPFELYPEYLDELINFIDTLSNLEPNENKMLKEIFKVISYSNIIEMKFHKFFETIDKHDFYVNKLKHKREEFDDLIEIIQSKLSINDTCIDRFDTNVYINVNLFEGYSINELCNIFEEINKFNSKLTEIELLACKLYTNCDFAITNNVLEKSIMNEIKEYYKEKCKDEILQCYNFEDNDEINAFDFIVGFQNYCNTTYTIIERSDNNGLSLFFKLYKMLYNGFDKFNNENVNNFIENIIYSCKMLSKITNTIFTSKINNKLFNSTCENKFKTLKRNNLYVIISSILGYKKLNIDEKCIINAIEKALLYHFILSDLKDIEKKKLYKDSDIIQYESGGNFIDNHAKTIYQKPSIICDKITKDIMDKLISELFLEGDKPIKRNLESGKKTEPNRRQRKFFEKCLLYYYYKSKVSLEILDNNFSIEHIYPFSSNWNNDLDIDRFGNIIPIIDEINNKRQNKHISKYEELDKEYNFMKWIKDIIPNIKSYDSIISHNDKTPLILDNKKYNELCKNNEKKYLVNFIKCLFLNQ